MRQKQSCFDEHLFARIWSRPPAEQSPKEEHAPLRDRVVVDYEDLFDRAKDGTITLDSAVYPAVCAVSSGKVTFALGRSGAMITHVRPGACGSREFRLRLLFETGACVFSSPRDLGHFCTGLLAAAFEIEPNEPIEAPRPISMPPVDEHGIEPASTPIDLLADLGAGAAAAGAATSATSTRPDGGATQADDPAPPADDPTQLPLPHRRMLTASSLATELARRIHGQEPALERVASVTVAQVTKRHPARPGSVMLIGPTGVGKTSTIEALPSALHALDYAGAHVFRIDCGEPADSIQVTRLLGSPPGYSGHAETTPLIAALSKPGCILLVDELDKAHDDVLDLLLGLLDHETG